MKRETNIARRPVFALGAVLLGCVVAVVVAEAAARTYVYLVAERGRLFQPHEDLGWAPIPNLDLVRRNPAGEHWRVRTNARGHRSLEEHLRADAARRVLVVGDSFAFGEGVGIEDRFDALLAERHPDWSFVNQGVMGYGTDQQMIAAREDIAQLREGDLLLIVSYVNDFLDLLMHSHSGRAKPWFELRDGELSEHSPRIGVAERLRDESYLLARIFQLLDRTSDDFTRGQLRTSGHLYRRIIEQETAEAIARGVHVLIAYHGSPTLNDASQSALKAAARDALTRLCETPDIDCVSLDPALTSALGLFQPDGHWSADGNAAVARVIERALAARAGGRDEG